MVTFLSRFPLLAANLSERRIAQVAKAIEQIAHAQANGGGIANPVHKDLKDSLNRALDDAWGKVIRDRFVVAGKWQALSEAERDLDYSLTHPMIHNLASEQKKVAKSKATGEYVDAVKAFHAEIAPLVEAFKGLVPVKRQPKPVEDVKEKYLAPRASESATAEVQKILFEVVDGAFQDLIKAFETRFNNYLNKYLTERKGPEHSVYNFFIAADRRAPNYEACEVVERATYNAGWNNVQPRTEAGEIITKLATDAATGLRNEYVVKNLKKLDSIIERQAAKGIALVKSEVVGRSVSLGGLEGQIRFTFDNGAAFTVAIQAVFVINSYGTRFYRFPVTFHNVTLANGQKMARPTEKKMNEEF